MTEEETQMSLETLLSPEHHPLVSLSLHRLRLTRADPAVEWKSDGDECLLYGLIGAVGLEATTDDGQRLAGELRPLRWRVDARGAVALRLPPGQPWTVILRVLDASADYLLVRRRANPLALDAAHPVNPGPRVPRRDAPAPLGPVLHEGHTDAVHPVGEGAWRREVRVFDLPDGYEIHAGETLNPPGHWSSWPSHAHPEDLGKWADWQECFFLVTPSPGLIVLDGHYCTGQRVNEIREATNGLALVTPLGSHPIVASPAAWLYYFWVYHGTALTKTYNRFATDVGAYGDSLR
jgi:5-deoxy-glucuronate isomerase